MLAHAWVAHDAHVALRPDKKVARCGHNSHGLCVDRKHHGADSVALGVSRSDGSWASEGLSQMAHLRC
jgi:hypothetical protein